MIEHMNPLLKRIIKYNLLDYSAAWTRIILRKLGVLESFDRNFYWVGRKIFRFILQHIFHWKTAGYSRAPEGQAIYICNHNHTIDPFIAGSASYKRIAWVSKIENFYVPIQRSLIVPFGTIPLRRGKSDDVTIRKVSETLKKGISVGMFPEGSRRVEGEQVLRPFHTGAARMCIENQVPYVPVIITGSYKLKKGGPLKVQFGNPVYIDPKIGLSYEAAKVVASEMYTDMVGLMEGRMNETRMIGISQILAQKSVERTLNVKHQ